ncbi:endonuclease/exonuclease/phosphatase family protein [Oricola thermophila]|uniref:Endonuclease/exonuclease/phosphatase family protein n=2 Tax=Oricola thermophila TaxID=2742145 RepID=A0A6N1VMZ1_9HYPH|nr:endonuclease/exonuclease/phosphatase family protein [Oricola thermophila]
MRIATFNVQNMRLRQVAGHPRLSGAKDHDAINEDIRDDFVLDPIDRLLTAAVLRRADADVVALQEVYDKETLDYFHENYLVARGMRPYEQRICLPGNDGRGYDVALMSRVELSDVISHAGVTAGELGIGNPPQRDENEPIFRRDCLSARVGPLTLYICHFKAPYPDPDDAWSARRLEALAVRRLIERQFSDPAAAMWIILGDLNEPLYETRRERAIAPLTDGFAVDLVKRHPTGRQWSYHLRDNDSYSRPDAMLASPALARAWPDAVPYYLREGLSRNARRYTGQRLPGVGEERPHASDHAALVIDLAGI